MARKGGARTLPLMTQKGACFAMTNRSIARRAGLIAAAPLAGLLAISAQMLDDDRNALQAARITEAAASLLPEISAFFHALQIERGAAIASVDGGRAGAGRARTDAAAEAMLDAITRLTPLLGGASAAGPRATLRIAEAAAAERGALRRLVDQGAPTADITLAYSATVDRLLSGIARLRQEAPNQQIANDVLSLISQLRISELSGLERAAGAAALAEGGFAPEDFTAFSSLAMQQGAVLKGLNMWVSPEIFVAIDEALATPQAREFVKRRTELLNARGEIPADFVDARTWRQIAAARIGALTGAESRTIARLTAALTEARKAAQTRVRGALAMTAMLGAMLGGAALSLSGTARRLVGGLVGAGAEGRSSGGSSSMMIVDSSGVVAFITPGLDAALLRSSGHFSALRPNADFDTIKGQNVDLFDGALPGGFRAMLDAIVEGDAGDLRFDGRRFTIVSSNVQSSNGATGHVIEWVERAGERGARAGFRFAAPFLRRRAA